MERAEMVALLQAEGPALGVVLGASDWEADAERYFSALGHMPTQCVADAFAAWKRGEGEKNPLWASIFPRPDQLAPLAEPFWLQERARQYRERREREGPRQFTTEERAAERQKMIDAGYLNADGTPNLTQKAREIPHEPRPRLDQHELAEQLRRTDAQARQGGAPISRSHIEAEDSGEVL